MASFIDQIFFPDFHLNFSHYIGRMICMASSINVVLGCGLHEYTPRSRNSTAAFWRLWSGATDAVLSASSRPYTLLVHNLGIVTEAGSELWLGLELVGVDALGPAVVALVSEVAVALSGALGCWRWPKSRT
ncbi:hypothetical protein ACU8KH_05410 [Lachancea thermotolerans]